MPVEAVEGQRLPRAVRATAATMGAGLATLGVAAVVLAPADLRRIASALALVAGLLGAVLCWYAVVG